MTSARFGYSLRVPHYWSIDTRGPADLLSGDETRHALPEVSVTVDSVSESSGCAPYDSRRFLVGGMKINVSVYRNCGAPHIESARFVHNGRRYLITWRGKATQPENDYARFDALLKTLTFSP